MKDYKFKFNISKNNNQYTHFNEFLKEHILDLLSFCDLYDENNNKVDVSSFKLKHPGEKRVELYDNYKEMVLKNTEDITLSEDEKAVDASEPRIAYIMKTLKKMNGLVDYYSDDTLCNINYIELKDCSNWLLHEKAHASAVYQCLAYTCNANCKFCYLQANPQNIRIGKKEKDADCSIEEIKTRIKYFNSDSNLFSTSYEIKEFFNSPHFEEAMKLLREKCNDDFMFVTNGSLLTEDRIKFLSTVKPVTLIISVVVISEKKRSELLFNEIVTDDREKMNQIMMRSFPLLNKYKIPFIGSITAWPTIEYSDFIETIHYLEQFNPVAIRINMLGYTEKNKPTVPVDDSFWYDFCEYIQKASKETDVPLLPIPSQYYINEFQKNVLDIEVMGVIKNSPAYGLLRRGDVIRKINGMSITSREQFLNALNLLKGDKVLTLERDGEVKELILKDQQEEIYPYTGVYYGKYQFPYGIVVPESIQLKQIQKVLSIMETKDKKDAILITGPLVQKTIFQYFENLGGSVDREANNVNINGRMIKVVPTKNYFLGGNMKIMDMCVISDFIKLVDLNKRETTDVVILPNSMFNFWGNDLLGINKDSFEKCLDVPVEYFDAITVPY